MEFQPNISKIVLIEKSNKPAPMIFSMQTNQTGGGKAIEIWTVLRETSWTDFVTIKKLIHQLQSDYL